MDLDDVGAKTTLSVGLGKEDLSTFSIEDLDDRIGLLEAEIGRCRAAKTSKESSLVAANLFFKS